MGVTQLEEDILKRIALAIGAGVVATGAVVASAASLGNLNVSTLGTSSDVVTSCATDTVNVTWNSTAPTYVAATTTYNTSTVTVEGPPECDGAAVRITVADSTGASLANANGNMGLTPVNLTLSAPVDSELIESTTVTIYNES